MSNLTDILRKVQALIAQADHPNTSTIEAETFRAKAEALMFKYRIDEITLSAAEKAQAAINVIWSEFPFCDAMSEYSDRYGSMVYSVLSHMDIRGVTKTRWNSELGINERCVIMVGYESDLQFAEMLITSACLAFSQKLEPKFDQSESEQLNAYRMRSAGMEGRRIALAIYGPSDNWKSQCVKVRKMFALEATARGEDASAVLGHGMKDFRASYALGFVAEFASRLQRMREARGQFGHELVMLNRKAEIDEAFYERYPQFRPIERPAIGQADTTRCAKCAKAQSGYCRDHSWMRPRAARNEREINWTAVGRGRDAARTVDLGITGREVN